MKLRSGSRRAFMIFVLGATILTSGPVHTSGREARRFLAVADLVRSSLVTIQTTQHTEIFGPNTLSAGARVRMVGSWRGTVFYASRIESI
ncbi:MAG: hypothetical protein M1318_06005 [Firmicutes bacterium]|nr:hypothetical protein [Bacillota bacterium]